MDESNIFVKILHWLVSADAGAFIVVSFFASWFLEKWAWWSKLDSNLKSLIVLVGSGLIGGGAAILNMYPDVVAAIAPVLTPFVYAIIAWLTTQVGHEFNPFRKKSE